MSNIVKFDYGKLERQQVLIKDVIRIKSVSEALEKRKAFPTLVTMKNDYGERKTIAYLELLILNVNEFFNVKEKMHPEQVQETATMIMEEYYYLSLLEILFVFKEAKRGVYGELYNSIDGSKILRWFSMYDEKRTVEAERQSIQESSQHSFRDEDLRLSKPKSVKDMYKKTKKDGRV